MTGVTIGSGVGALSHHSWGIRSRTPQAAWRPGAPTGSVITLLTLAQCYSICNWHVPLANRRDITMPAVFTIMQNILDGRLDG